MIIFKYFLKKGHINDVNLTPTVPVNPTLTPKKSIVVRFLLAFTAFKSTTLIFEYSIIVYKG
jgi:hypothetical protein